MTPEVSAGSTPVVRNDDVILRTDVSNIAKLQNIECKIPKIPRRKMENTDQNTVKTVFGRSKRLKNTENTLQKTVIFPPKFGIFETFVSEYLSLRLLVSRAQLHSTTMFSAPYRRTI